MIQTVIQYSKRIASYLYLRDGVYYFQIRLQRQDARQDTYKSGLIRKSLKTRDHREAANKARILWVHYMKHKLIFKDGDDPEIQMQYQNDLYSRGKQLHQEYDEIDPHDMNAKDDFFELGLGSNKGYSVEFDQEAFRFYADHLRGAKITGHHHMRNH